MPAATRTAAIFDFDGTIIAGYSILAFLKERVRRRELGVEHVLCTRLEARDGVLTGKSSGPILWGRAKADAVREFARREGIALRRSHFYADGDEDVALMHRVGHPHPTNPRPGLERAAVEKGWPVQRFTSRARPEPDAYLRGALAKKELERVPLFAAASRFMHIAFVDRSDSKAAVAALEPATKLLGEGISMLVAPEGRRVAGTGIGEFKKGAFRMAMAAQVPVVPIVIRNVDDIGTGTSGTMRPGIVDVAVLPPVRMDDWTPRNLDGRIADVRQAFVDTLERWPAPRMQQTPRRGRK